MVRSREKALGYGLPGPHPRYNFYAPLSVLARVWTEEIKLDQTGLEMSVTVNLSE